MATKNFNSSKNSRALSNKAPDHVRSLFGGQQSNSNADADWSLVPGDVLHNLLWAVSYLSGSVTLSTTKNGKAYSIKLYVGEPFDPRYYDGTEEGRAELAAWVDSLVKALAESA